MASSGKHLFFFCLLVTFSSIQARESMFFSKFTRHYSITKENGKKGPITILAVPIQAPTPAPAPSPASLLDVPEPAPAPVFGESEKGHGLFGEGSGMFPPKETSTTTTTYADENELLNEELDGVTSDQKYENSNYNNNGYTSTYNNNGYERSNYNNKNNNNGYKLGSARYETGNQNNNGYTNKYYNNGYKLAGESYEAGNQNTENGYNNNGNTNNYNNEGYTNKYYNNGYKLAGESQEAGNQNSENGYSNNGNTNNYNNKGYTNKYYNNGYKLAGESYEAGNQNSDNGYTRYETERQGMSDTRFMEGGKYYYNAKNENYYPANKYESGKVSTQNQGSYGNDENPNEFNTMEEYKSQEGYEESQEESLP
ncbi:uncharacterized protein LOC7459967 isoform X3 [Populus trichocarpa]|uniref:uncharacterized protein LOC7459967 isoform X3 n=1 Tax=Populus trichocarpa TaxID=3694 RepID=UPI00227772D3|nr:uncharacterized protein LOC7459967 isoform X3 [Populus trichocarpa]